MPRICHAATLSLSCLMTICMHAQNLVPNPDFESFTSCPVNINMGEPLQCPPWTIPTGGTTDYFNVCHTGGIVGVPNNIFGVMPAHSGVAYTGILLYYSTWLDYREFLQVQLDAPMIAGYPYVVSFWYTLSSNSCPTNRLGVHISDTPPTDPLTFGPLPVTPQLDPDNGLIGLSEWQYFRYCYIATGGEEWITIGNFHTDADISIGSGCGSGLIYSYLYIDDVAVEPGTPPDAVDLGGPLALCPGETIVFDFDPGYGDYLWQDGSTSASYTISAPGIYALTLTTECLVIEEQVEVVAVELPAFEMGPDTSICAWDALVLNFDPMLGDFLWQDGSADPFYTITDPGTYALTVSSACGAVSDAITVDHYPDPFVVFPDDTVSTCAGEPVVFTFDPEIGEYYWQDGTSGPEYMAIQPGTYSVTVVNPCGSDFASVVVEVVEAPEPALGPDLTLCPAQLPYAIDLSGLENAVAFLWGDGSTGAQFSIENPGTYVVTVSNACFSVKDSLTVVVEDLPPAADLGPDTTLCPGDTLVFDLTNVPGSYLWQDSSDAAQFIVSNAGIYSVQVINACGQAGDTITVAYSAPVGKPDLGPDISLCPGEQAAIHAGMSGVQYLWENLTTGAISTEDSIVVGMAGTIVLTISDACTSVSDTISVTLDAMGPELILPEQVALCDGDSVSIGTVLTGVTYAWNTGATTPDIIAFTEGQYILIVSNACGSDTDTTTVVSLGGAPAVDLGDDFGICAGDTVILDPGIPDVTYSWHISSGGSSTAETFRVTKPGVISVTVTNNCGSASDTVVVTQNALPPIVNFGPDITICETDEFLIDPGIQGVSYLWHDGSTGSTFLVTEETLVSLEVSNGCGTDSDTILINVEGHPPIVDLGPDTVLCAGTSLTLSVDDDDTWITWQNGSMLPTQTITQPGLYAVTVTAICGEDRDTIVVGTLEPPKPFELGPDRIICPSDILILEIPPPDSLSMVEWNTGSTLPQIAITDAGFYALTVTNACGSFTDDITIEVDTQQLAASDENHFVYCPDDELILDVTQTIPATYQWDDGSTAPQLSIHQPAMYTVTITSTCDAIVQDFIVEEGTCASRDIFIPNVFSPNNDYFNDAFSIAMDPSNVLDFNISIYDRWGNTVFRSSDPGFTWYGDVNGKVLNPGVYVYYLTLTRQAGTAVRTEERSGDVTLLR